RTIPATRPSPNGRRARRWGRARNSAAWHSSSATAIAGEGDHPAKQGGGGGACLNVPQESLKYADFKLARFFAARERSNFIVVILLQRQRSGESRCPTPRAHPSPPPPPAPPPRPRAPPPPRWGGGGKFLHSPAVSAGAKPRAIGELRTAVTA